MLGLLLWHVAGEIGGDGLFHLARARKLVELGDLHLSSVNEFADGGLHPGYAFPLWQAFLALIAKVAFVDPSKVVLHEATVLAPLAVLAAYEAGYALFRRVVPAAASAGAAVGIAAMAAGHGGSFTSLALPATVVAPAPRPGRARARVRGACATRRRGSSRAPASRRSCSPSSTRPTRSSSGSRLPASSPCAGPGGARSSAAARSPSPRSSCRPGSSSPGSCPSSARRPRSAPTRTSARAGSSTTPASSTARPTSSGSRPQVFGRSGAIAVAALLLIPFAVFASRRRWAAYVVGGSLAVFAITLVPWLFTPFSDVVSLSQSRRLAGFIPFSFALAGGMGVLAALLGRFVVPLALVAGIVLQWQYPGDFGYALHDGGPAWATWIAVVGALVALVVGLWRLRSLETTAALASALVLLPTFVYGLSHWSPSPARTARPLTPALVEKLRTVVPKADIVYSDPESSYEIAAAAPVYICVAPPGSRGRHRSRTSPYVRRDQWLPTSTAPATSAIPKRCGARWLLIDRERSHLAPKLPIVYRDARYVLYSIPRV